MLGLGNLHFVLQTVSKSLHPWRKMLSLSSKAGCLLYKHLWKKSLEQRQSVLWLTKGTETWEIREELFLQQMQLLSLSRDQPNGGNGKSVTTGHPPNSYGGDSFTWHWMTLESWRPERKSQQSDGMIFSTSSKLLIPLPSHINWNPRKSGRE